METGPSASPGGAAAEGYRFLAGGVAPGTGAVMGAAAGASSKEMAALTAYTQPKLAGDGGDCAIK